MSAPVSPALSAEASAMVQRTLASLREEFDVSQSEFSIAGRMVTIYHPRNADDLISEKDYVKDERLPYWADIWPSSRVLAEYVARMRADNRRVLELGCGSGLVSVAAAIAGFELTASDYYEDALRFTALNVLANTGKLIETREADWRHFPHDMGRFDLVVASDVLYEREYATLVASVIDRTLTGRGTALIGDPGRLAAPEFVEQCKERGMPTAILDRIPFEDGAVKQIIDLYEVRRR